MNFERRSIAICGSMQFIEEIKTLAEDLSSKGVASYIPEEQEKAISRELLGEKEFSKVKGSYIETHLLKIEQSDKVLVANYRKNGIKGYIGPNSLIELAFGYALRKELFLLYEPEEQNCKPEVMGLQVKVLHGDISRMCSNTFELS